MNRKQTYLLLLVGIVIFLFVIFPPYQRAIFGVNGSGLTNVELIGFYPLLIPPEVEGSRTVVNIDYGRLLIQVGGVCALALGMYPFLGRT